MGLYSNLNDVSSDSIPLLLVAIIANCVNYLRSLLFGFFQSMGLSARLDRSSRIDHVGLVGEGLLSAVGSGLAGLIVLTEQLNSHRVFDYRCSGGEGEKCVVCLCRLRNGEQVRRIGCGHVFHKGCLDMWLFDHSNFTCPLCRSPLVSQDRLLDIQRRLAGDLITCFSVR